MVGVWQLQASRISPGGPVDWTEVTNGNHFTFELDGNFRYTNFNTDEAIQGTYRLTDSTLTLTTQEAEHPSGTYFLNLGEAQMILQNIRCIESCSLRYGRIE